MGSFIFTILIWLLLIPEFLTDNTAIKIVIVIIQVLLLIAQFIYILLKNKN